MCANFRDPDSKIPSPASVSAARRLLLRRRRRLMLGNELASTEVDEFTGRMPPPPIRQRMETLILLFFR